MSCGCKAKEDRRLVREVLRRQLEVARLEAANYRYAQFNLVAGKPNTMEADFGSFAEVRKTVIDVFHVSGVFPTGCVLLTDRTRHIIPCTALVFTERTKSLHLRVAVPPRVPLLLESTSVASQILFAVYVPEEEWRCPDEYL